jgi:hypothetical protein
LNSPGFTIFEFARRNSSVCFAGAAMLLFLSFLWLLPAATSGGERQWLSEVIREYKFTSSDDQRWAYLIAVVAVAMFSAISFLLGGRGTVSSYRLRIVPKLSAIACLALAALGLFCYRFLVPASNVSDAAAIVGLFLVFVFVSNRLSASLIERTSIALVGAYLAILIVPGLLVRPIPFMFNDPVLLVQIETHMLSLSMRGAAVAAGQNFFDELQLNYGLLMPSIMSVLEMKRQGLSLAGQLRFVQLCQALFCLAAVCAYFAYRPRNHFGILAALLLAGPFWATAGLGIWHPNQTGFRSLGLPVGMLALVLAGRLSADRAVWWLGAVAGVAVLMNLETAIAISVGYTVFLIVRTRAFPVALFLHMAVAAALVIVVYLLIYPLALGRFPFGTEALNPLSLVKKFSASGYGLRLFSSGHAGEGFYFVPFALVMFAHAMYVVIDGFRRLGRGLLPLRAALRVSIAATLIVWLAYYFNAPNWWQIWTHLFLYGFLLMDLLDRRLLGIGVLPPNISLSSRLASMRMRPALFVILFLLAFLIPNTNRYLSYYASAFMYPAWIYSVPEVSVVSGVLLSKDKADLLQRKARKLKELHVATGGNLVYLTFNMAFMPMLTRIYQPGPLRDMFAEVPGDVALKATMDDLLKQRPEVILIDAPTGPLAVSGPRADFQDRLRAAIGSAYRVTSTEDGWQVWQPIDAR